MNQFKSFRNPLQPSLLPTVGNHVLLYFALTWLFALTTFQPYFGPAELLTVICVTRVVPMKNPSHIWTVALFHLLARSVSLLPLVPSFFYIMALQDLGLLNPKAKPLLQPIINVSENLRSQVNFAITTPIAGCNSKIVWIDDLVTTVTDQVKNFIDPLFSMTLLCYQVKAQYLRPIAANSNVVPISERPTIEGDLTRKALIQRQQQQKMAIIVASVLSLFLILHLPLVLAAVVGFLASKTLQDKSKGVRRDKATPMVKTGVYLITTEIYGLEISRGIGVSLNGVLHTPYHVSSGSNIILDNAILRPSYWNTEQDLCTYSGMPQFSSVTPGSSVYINCDSEETRTTYVAEVAVDTRQSMLAWFGKSRPGESGSPVFTIDSAGVVHLHGLAGRYYRSESMVVEYCFTDLITSLTVDENTNLQKHVVHCGAGKTWKIIPELVAKAVTDTSKKVLVTGPTRVVCKELAQSLSKNFTVSYNVSGTTTYSKSCQIQISAHHTSLAMIMNQSPHLNNLGTVIIDEAHVDDMSTKALRVWAEHFAEQGGKVHLLSATLDGEVAPDTNYNVHDEMISEDEIPNVVEFLMEKNRRTMVFVPSLKSPVVHKIEKKCPNVNTIKLSRDTYDQVGDRLADSNVDLIITTNIAECGLNAGQVDAVVDTSQVFKFWHGNGVVYGATKTINLASKIQRRGRTGRVALGAYYYVKEPEEWTEKTSAELDCDILCTGRSWAPGAENELHVYLSDKQAECAMSRTSKCPLEVHMTRDALGQLSSTISHIMAHRIRTGKISLVHCDIINCPCLQEKWRWFDQRIHDLLVGKAQDQPIIRF